jgi:hypothetical protein
MAYVPDWLNSETPEERAWKMRGIALNQPGGGAAESNYRSNHGSAPYEETLNRARQRLGWRDILLGAAAGLSAGPGLNPAYSFGRGFAASYGRSQAAHDAAMKYAEDQAQRKAAEEDKAYQREKDAAYLRIAEKNATKPPEKPAPPPKLTKAQEAEATLGRPLTETEKQIVAGVYREPKVVKPPKATAPPKPGAAEKPATGAERQTLAFYNRAQDASNAIAKIEDKISGENWIKQIQLERAPNWAKSPTQQVYRQAQRAFTEARLRKESGAQISASEYENDAKTYFAQPGDSQDVVERKRKSRQVVLNGLKFGAGKAYKEFYGNQGNAGPPTSTFSPEAARQKYGY